MANKEEEKNNTIEEEMEEEEEDRLSTLPDDILVRIISLLPTKMAVATSLLSRRWRCLWTKSTSSMFRFNVFEEKDEVYAANFINQVITDNTSPFIHKFTLHITPLSYFAIKHLQPNGYENYFISWLHQLCSRKVEQIHIKGIYDPPDDRLIRLKLPPCVFQSSSLIVLDLDPTFSCELPTFKDDIGEIHLPNLKSLRIGLSISCYEQFSELVSSCPSLEVLTFQVSVESPCFKPVFLEISSQSLKYLSINLPRFFFNNKGNLHVNAPNLVSVCSNLDAVSGVANHLLHTSE